MCILVGGEAVRVSGTSIFARHCAPGRQVLVYSMRVFARTPTAMILPLPVVKVEDVGDFEASFVPTRAELRCDASESGMLTWLRGLALLRYPELVRDLGERRFHLLTVAEVQRQHQTLYSRADKLEVENKWLRRRVVDMERMVKALQGAMTAGTNISISGR